MTLSNALTQKVIFCGFQFFLHIANFVDSLSLFLRHYLDFYFLLFDDLNFFLIFFGFHFEFLVFYWKITCIFIFKRKIHIQFSQKNCHSMSIKKNQTFLCYIKILQTFTNKLLYQTLNIYKKEYLHFSPLPLWKISKLIFLYVLLYVYQKIVQNTNFEQKWKKKKKTCLSTLQVHPSKRKSKNIKGKKIGVSKRLKKWKEIFFLKEKEKKENGFKKLSKSKIHNENKRSFAKWTLMKI